MRSEDDFSAATRWRSLSTLSRIHSMQPLKYKFTVIATVMMVMGVLTYMCTGKYVLLLHLRTFIFISLCVVVGFFTFYHFSLLFTHRGVDSWLCRYLAAAYCFHMGEGPWEVHGQIVFATNSPNGWLPESLKLSGSLRSNASCNYCKTTFLTKTDRRGMPFSLVVAPYSEPIVPYLRRRRIHCSRSGKSMANFIGINKLICRVLLSIETTSLDGNCWRWQK